MKKSLVLQILTPPPVPLRIAPVVPKRKYIPNKLETQQKTEIQKQILQQKIKPQNELQIQRQYSQLQDQQQNEVQFANQRIYQQKNEIQKHFQQEQAKEKGCQQVEVPFSNQMHHRIKEKSSEIQFSNQRQYQHKEKVVRKTYKKEEMLHHPVQNIYEQAKSNLKLVNGEGIDGNERNDNENWKYLSQLPPTTIRKVPSTNLPNISAQKTRQAVKSQMSIESSKQLKHSAVLSSENLDKTIHIKNPQILQQYSNNISISKLTNSQEIDKAGMQNSKQVFQQNGATKQSNYTDIRTAPAFKKKLPPPPTEPPPSVPRTASKTEVAKPQTTPKSPSFPSPTNSPKANTVPLPFPKTNHPEITPITPEPPTQPQKNPKPEPNIPPPLSHPDAIQNSPSSNKMSMRQDSGVSSDSFSQTSSPSYTTKTMETPLIPSNPNRYVNCNGRMSSSRNNKLYNIVVNKNSCSHGHESFDLDGTGKNIVTCSSPLTKSLSTPASLQTIVRFHNGSNMSLHHRVS